jgi:hypothetical protein
MTEKAVPRPSQLKLVSHTCLGACIFAIIIAYYMYLTIQNIYWNVIISCLLGIICTAGLIIKIPLNRYVKFEADLRKGRISIPFREKMRRIDILLETLLSWQFDVWYIKLKD